MSDNKDSVTKIFLSESGVLKVGQFPEVPPISISANQDAARMRSYDKTVEAAKASAVEIVENIRLRKDTIGDHQFGIGSINADPASIQWHRAHEVIDLPPGWTVEYFCDHFKTMRPEFCSRCMGKCPDWRARLVQSKPAGIVATGIPEPEQPDKAPEFDRFMVCGPAIKTPNMDKLAEKIHSAVKSELTERVHGLQDENKRLREEIRDLKAWKTSEI